MKENKIHKKNYTSKMDMLRVFFDEVLRSNSVILSNVPTIFDALYYICNIKLRKITYSVKTVLKQKSYRANLGILHFNILGLSKSIRKISQNLVQVPNYFLVLYF